MAIRKVARPAVLVLAFALPCAGVSFQACSAEPASTKAAIDARYSGVKWVNGSDLTTWMARPAEKRPVLLDVRTHEEFSVSHLQNARRVDPDKPGIASLHLPTDSQVVVYCSVGYRSAAIIDDLREAGVTNVHNLVGGIFQWANDDRPLFRDNQPASRVHPYNPTWGQLLDESRRAPLER